MGKFYPPRRIREGRLVAIKRALVVQKVKEALPVQRMRKRKMSRIKSLKRARLALRTAMASKRAKYGLTIHGMTYNFGETVYYWNAEGKILSGMLFTINGSTAMAEEAEGADSEAVGVLQVVEIPSKRIIPTQKQHQRYKATQASMRPLRKFLPRAMQGDANPLYDCYVHCKLERFVNSAICPSCRRWD